VVILYVYTIQQRNAAEDNYRAYFDAAAKCQSQISSVAENESLAQRYTVVLEELRMEAIKQTQRPESQTGNELNSILESSFLAPQADMGPSQSLGPDGSNQDAMQPPVGIFSDPAIFGDGQNATTPSSLMAELTSWGEFDSLVSLPIASLSLLIGPALGHSRNWRARFYIYGRSEPVLGRWHEG
jgi:hypothetical protein